MSYSTYARAIEAFRDKELFLSAVDAIGLSDADVETLWEECLNELYEAISIGSLTYQPADVLRSVDPVAYRQGLLDYLDVSDIVEIDGVYFHEDRLVEFLEEQEKTA